MFGRIRNRLFILCVTFIVARGSSAQVRPIYDYGTAGLIHLLERIPTTASVLHTGAHPDDEDSALMARVARGDNARIAYLSLTRGDGGQNVIGPELFEALGVIRTEELLQARRLDGGDQLFTRAYDFGYSKTLEETVQKWGEDIVLGDMVRAVRMYRPLVMIAAFPATAQAGHGHHQYAGYLTPIAFHQAADPGTYPEQMAEGLQPWQPLKLYVRHRSRPDSIEQGALRVPTGNLDRANGRTYFEIALQGRSQHKTQGMGTLELRGPHSSEYRLLESHVSTPMPEASIFDGMDTSLRGLPGLIGLPEGLIDEALSRAQAAAEKALDGLDPLEPSKIVPLLTEGLGAVREARESIEKSSIGEAARYDADFLLRIKEREFGEALERAAGVVVDALAEVETLVPGESTRVDARVFFPESSPVGVERIEVDAPEGWGIRPTTAGESMERAQKQASFLLTAAEDSPWTEPYWLRESRQGDLFSWPYDSPKGLPFGPPVVEVQAHLQIGGAPVTVKKSVEYRFADPIRGEIWRNLNVVPGLSVSLDSNLLIVPTSSSPQKKQVAVQVENNAQESKSGVVELELPSGWNSAPNEASFSLARKGEATALFFDVEIPGNAPTSGYAVKAKAASGGENFDRRMRTIAYPHIQTHRFYTPAEMTVRVLDLKVKDVRVGYIMGSGDRVPEAIRRLGLEVTLLDESDLATGDLSQFDVIVVGIRASRVRPDFVAMNGRLLDFMRQGGTLIVQYQRQDYVARHLTPYPAKMSPSPSYSSYRVTDETAKVTILHPEHPVFNFPNRISDADWEGWVQERSTYQLTDLDPRYTPLLEAADPGEEPSDGGLVYAEVGKGKYVYAGFSFFRQLPAGVPGAYRLFANLLSL
jgi:LmbE family N-acetylglucosaminyl deacetylase